MPIAPFGSVFWFRVKALAPLFDHGWQHEDFPPEPLPQDGTISHAIERIYPFVAQGAGYYPAQAMSVDYAVARCDSMQAYAGGLIRPLARVFDCTTFGSAAASAGAFAARRHWFGFGNYGPYENSKRRRARNWLRKRMPKSAYENMMRVKRTVLGPHDVNYED